MPILQHARIAMADTSTQPVNSAPAAPQSAAPAPAKTPKKRGRKKPADALAALEEKKAQIEARIKKESAKVKQEERKLDTRRKIVVGAIALEHMNHDDAFRATMAKLMDEHLSDKDKALFE